MNNKKAIGYGLAIAGVGIIIYAAYSVLGKKQECSPDGITKCDGYDLYTCINGQWILTDKDAPECGWEPPQCKDYTSIQECLSHDCYWYDNSCHNNPECAPDGITKCIGPDLYECQNGGWVLKQSNSPQCTEGEIKVTNVEVRK